MRSLGLTLCLLASSFGARAESVEDRVAALEARVKALEQALRTQPAPSLANAADGHYKGTLPNGASITVELAAGHFVASTDEGSKTGTFEIVGDKLIANVDGKPELLLIQGNHLKNDKIDLLKSK